MRRMFITNPANDKKHAIWGHLKKSQGALAKADISHGHSDRIEARLNKMPVGDMIAAMRRIRTRAADDMHIPSQFSKVHAILSYICGGKLAGKNILNIAASTGVYVGFLQKECGARAVGVDKNREFLRDARSQGVKHMHFADVLKRMRFKSGTFDFVVSEHFLFANYYKGLRGGGIEERAKSIKSSEDVLKELNRVLKVGGFTLIGSAHGAVIPDLKKYVKGYEVNGFIVEEVFNADFNNNTTEPEFIVFRKVRNLK